MGTNERSKITMTDDEIAAFIEQSRTTTMATLGPKGMPHLVAMWYAVIDGKLWFETKKKSQKVLMPTWRSSHTHMPSSSLILSMLCPVRQKAK